MPRPEVVFCGGSLYLSSLASGLQVGGRWRVVRLESAFAHLAEELRMLRPDAVVFELDTAHCDRAISELLRAHPGIRLIGLDPAGGSLTVFSRTGRRTAPIEELGTMLGG